MEPWSPSKRRSTSARRGSKVWDCLTRSENERHAGSDDRHRKPYACHHAFPCCEHEEFPAAKPICSRRMLGRAGCVARAGSGLRRSAARWMSSQSDQELMKPWEQKMSDDDFELMRRVLAAPSPVGLEAGMTQGVLEPAYRSFAPSSWDIRRFKGNAGLVVDTSPGNNHALTCMIVGHADKIRMQVRHIDSNGKVYINTDSFLPLTLLGNEVTIFSEDGGNPGTYRTIKGGTVEALGAIHFASEALRSGRQGVTRDQVYIELHIHGERKQDQVTKLLGIRPGDTVLLDRPIKPGFSPNTFQGAYLDNGLGCFVTTKVAELVKENPLPDIRCLFTTATYEEIGRFGSRVQAADLRPDILIAVDVNHDYANAPNIGGKRYPPLEMGKGTTLSIGSITSPFLNQLIQRACIEHEIPLQCDMVGHDTGTDAMGGVLGAVDCAAASVGIPIRNMHTISEAGHTGDVIATIHAVFRTLEKIQKERVSRHSFMENHPDLNRAIRIDTFPKTWEDIEDEGESKDKS